MGNIDSYPTYKGEKVTELVVYANYIGLRWFYRYVVNIGRWSPYEGGQLDRFHCTTFFTVIHNGNYGCRFIYTLKETATFTAPISM